MRVLFLLFVVFLIVPLKLKAQLNLIQDSGFDSVNCDLKIIPHNLKYWQPIAIGAAKIMNQCFLTIIREQAVPFNNPNIFAAQYNYQPTLSGDGYVSVMVYEHNPVYKLDRRGYWATKLLKSLKRNVAYYIRFYAAPHYPYDKAIKWYYNDAVGLAFTERFLDNVNDTFNPYFQIKPAIENRGKLITDTMNWTRIRGRFIADGTENYAVLGNFRKIDETLIKWDIVNIDDQFKPNFFYLEDVVVSEFDPLPDTAILCTNSKLTFDAHFYDVTSYEWNTGSKDSILTIDKPGMYAVTAFVGDFSFSDTVVVIPEKEYKGLPKDTVLCKSGSPITLSLLNGFQYKWSTGATSNAIQVKNATTYTVTMTTPQCILQFSTVVKTENCLCNFYAPNSFSPNDDGVNDGFKPFINCKIVSIKAYQLSIFNRFGDLVFTTNDPNESWDGTYRGKKCTTDVFAWVVQYSVNSDKDVGIDTFTESGDVTILR